MAEAVYILCAVTSLICAGLLYRSYRRTRSRLLLWPSVCFGALAVNNVLLVVDLLIVPTIDLGIVRAATALTAGCVLLFGLIWEAR